MRTHAQFDLLLKCLVLVLEERLHEFATSHAPSEIASLFFSGLGLMLWFICVNKQQGQIKSMNIYIYSKGCMYIYIPMTNTIILRIHMYTHEQACKPLTYTVKDARYIIPI